MFYRRKRSANCEDHFRDILFHYQDIQVDFILMIIKNSSTLYYKLVLQIRPSQFVKQSGKFKMNGVLHDKTNIQEGIFLSFRLN